MYLEVRLACGLIIMAALLTKSSSEIFTSMMKIERMAMEEEELLTHLKQYIDLQYDKLKAISNFYADRMRNVHTRPGLEHTLGQLNHPNSVFKVINQFALDYTQSLGDHFGNFYDIVTKTTKHYLANTDDVQGAANSLLRLQSVYNLTALNMANGDYLGFLGPKLSHADAYAIGKTAFTGNQLNQSLDWLNTSLALINTSTEIPMEAAVRGLLGRVYLYTGQKERAWAEYNNSKTLDPDNDDAILLGEELKSLPFHEDISPEESFHNFSRLCSMENRLVPADSNDPRIACRYREAVLPYYRFKEEILSVDPFASVIYNVLSDEESEHLKGFVKGRLRRGETFKSSTTSGISDYRTGDLSWIWDYESRIASSVSRRIECITGLDLEQGSTDEAFSGEPYQVSNYGLGGHYDVHTDAVNDFELRPQLRESGDRLATFLIYLNDVERGGSTVFTRAGVAVPPVKNMALLWYNFKTAHLLDPLTDHGGCPVLIGQKWIANKWIWSHGNTLRRRCGLSPTATQLDIEPDMKKGYNSI